MIGISSIFSKIENKLPFFFEQCDGRNEHFNQIVRMLFLPPSDGLSQLSLAMPSYIS